MHFHIIIPYHSEPKHLYQNLLSKINNQINIDFKDVSIVICRSDGVGVFPDLEDWSNLKPITTFISKETPLPGPGWSREVGLEYVKHFYSGGNDWVLFFDIDDNIVDNEVLSKLKSYVEWNPDVDDMTFSYLRLGIGSTMAYYYSNPPWEIWSTLFKLSFMIKYNLRCALTCRVREDSFLTVCRYSVPGAKHVFIDYPYYTYTWGRKDSTLNSDFSRYVGEKDLKEHLNYWEEFKAWDCHGKPFNVLLELMLDPVYELLKSLPPEVYFKYKTQIDEIIKVASKTESAKSTVQKMNELISSYSTV